MNQFFSCVVLVSYQILFFAGEHTSKRHWSTVHGAWETGLEAGRNAAHRIYHMRRHKHQAYM